MGYKRPSSETWGPSGWHVTASAKPGDPTSQGFCIWKAWGWPGHEETGHHFTGGHSSFINVRTPPNYGIRKRGTHASGLTLLMSTVAILVYTGLFFKIVWFPTRMTFVPKGRFDNVKPCLTLSFLVVTTWDRGSAAGI